VPPRRVGPSAVLALAIAAVVGCGPHRIASRRDLPTPALNVDVDGVRINYTRDGAGSTDRPTLVLVHGFGASLDSWNDVHLALASAFPVVRLDLKGSGFSDKPDDGRYAVDDQARLLRDFLHRTGLTRVVLVGHSLGGGIAIETVVANASDPNPIRIDGLVLIDPAGYPQRYPDFVAMLRNPVTRFLSQFTSPEFRVRYVLERSFAIAARVTDERVRRYAYYLRLPGAERALASTAQQLRYGTLDDLRRELAGIRVPTQIVWGERDRVFPCRDAQFFHDAIADSVLSTLPASGHVPQEEEPGPTATILKSFLARVSPP